MDMKKTIEEILTQLPNAKITGGHGDKSVTQLTIDSRTAGPGSLFICLKGEHTNGHAYADKAAAQGASAILAEEDVGVPESTGCAVIRVPSTQKAMMRLAPWFYEYPASKMRMIGVTGTNGKTTTTTILRDLFTENGHKVGLIGTIHNCIGDTVIPSHNTTPDVVDLQRMLYDMQQAGCDIVVMEVSSHALALNRVAGIEYNTAVFTNLTQDHLDFHKTMENYREAKAQLFLHLHEGKKSNKTAIFNADDPSAAIIMQRVQTKVMTFGMKDTYDVYPYTFHVAATHMELHLHTPLGDMQLKLHITGEFNVYNVMGTICAAIAEGLSKEEIEKGLNAFQGVPGRFQLIHAGQPFTVIVDYAHTPDGLENVLHTSREITRGKLWVVFGCGGDRDRKKRPIMGKIALDLADVLVVTSDNPRSENPEAIIQDIQAGLVNPPPEKEIHSITDRKAAIEYAISHAAPEDVVMIAGKGHENYQILKDRTIHFDDGEVVRKYFQKGTDHADC